MSDRTKADRHEAAVAEAPPTVAVTKPAAKLKLGGDEIIQLSIRPSPWFIVLQSYRLALAMAALGAAIVIAARGAATYALIAALTLVFLIAFGGVVVATLQWASRIYVLTNRRVMRFHGVVNVDVVERPLERIREARLELSWHSQMLRIGSIRLIPVEEGDERLLWEHVAKPAEIHTILARAIQRSHSG